jgi:thiosulfate reductase cytochrome b subunit
LGWEAGLLESYNVANILPDTVYEVVVGGAMATHVAAAWLLRLTELGQLAATTIAVVRAS